MGPAPLNVPASPSPNKTPKISGSSLNGATKQPAAAKNLVPNDISSPHELTAFVRLSPTPRAGPNTSTEHLAVRSPVCLSWVAGFE